jgi:hypothetical protein
LALPSQSRFAAAASELIERWDPHLARLPRGRLGATHAAAPQTTARHFFMPAGH